LIRYLGEGRKERERIIKMSNNMKLEDYSVTELLEKIQNYNLKNPQYKGLAYLGLYDDGSGGLRYDGDNYFELETMDLIDIEILLKEY
jgi:hypothetical protein